MKKETFYGMVNGVEFEHYEDMAKYVNDLAKQGIPVRSYRTEYKEVCEPDNNDVKPETKPHTFAPIPKEYRDIYEYLVVDPRQLQLEKIDGYENDDIIMKDTDAKLEKRMNYYSENIGDIDNAKCDKVRADIAERVEKMRPHFDRLKKEIEDEINRVSKEFDALYDRREVIDLIEGYNEALHDICNK